MKINQNFQLCSINLTLIFEKSFRQLLSFWVVYTKIPPLQKKSILRDMGLTFLDSVKNLDLI